MEWLEEGADYVSRGGYKGLSEEGLFDRPNI